MAHKDETAALYELYKYFSGFSPYSGGPNSSNSWDDIAGNLTGWGKTTADQGLGSGWAIDDGIYQSPSTSCGYNYIIYIANNSNGQTGSTENVYQSAVVPPLAAWVAYILCKELRARDGPARTAPVVSTVDAGVVAGK